LEQIKSPQVHPSSLTELQRLWDNDTIKHKEEYFFTMIQYKENKTKILRDITDLKGEITKSFVTSVKSQETVLLNNPDTTKNKYSGIKKEALAAYQFWTSHRKDWIAIGHQQALDANLHNEQKAKNFEERKESAAYNQAVSVLFNSKNILTNSMNKKAQSTKTTWKNQISIQPWQQIQPLPCTSIPARSNISSNGYDYESSSRPTVLWNEQRFRKRKRKWERNLQGKRNERFHFQPTNVIMSKNRRPFKFHTALKKQKNNLLLEFQENILSLQSIGVTDPQVHNISTKNIPQHLLNSLALGHKFIASSKDKPDLLINSFKHFIRSTRLKWFFKDDEQTEKPTYWIPSTWQPPTDNIHPYIENCLTKLYTNLTSSTNSHYYNISKVQLSNLKLLINDPEILIVTADKNLGYVITDTEWYINACYAHLLSDSYINVTEDFNQNDQGQTTTLDLFTILCDKINECAKNSILTTDEAKWICQKEDFCPSKFYILPKIHKQPIKGRPIVPSMTWITFHLSEWIANQLNPLINTYCDNVLKDSTTLLHHLTEINKMKINTHQYILLSADVEALYPNMDIFTGLTLIKNLLIDLDWETPNKRDFLLWAIEFVLTKGYIEFNGKIFQQTNGAAMGSPMIPPYANLFMHMLEKNLVDYYLTNQNLLLYKRFIDDIFIIVKNDPIIIKTFIEAMNHLAPFIKLTWTKPSHQVDFLDITIILNHRKSIIDSVTFQKPLNKYSYLPYHSFHTPSMKLGFIKGEAIRYVRTCSRKRDFNRMISLFTIRLQRRGYPLKIIKDITSQVKFSQRLQYLTFKDSKKKNIPYIFKILYNHKISNNYLRQQLNYFSQQITSTISDLPKSLKEKITICYKLPSTLHKKVLKARKAKGL
jgi:hypothetical protein